MKQVIYYDYYLIVKMRKLHPLIKMLTLNKYNIQKDTYIEFAWSIKNETDRVINKKILPQYCFDIIIPLNVGLSVRNKLISDPFVSPILSKPKVISFPAGADIFGIRVHPLFFSQISELQSLDQLEEEPNNFKNVLNKGICDLIESIDPLNPVNIVPPFINECELSIVNESSNHDNIRAMIGKIIAKAINFTDYKLKDIYEELGISRRTAELHFRRFLGHSPKKIIQIIKVNQLIDMLRDGEHLFEAGYELGYYDQSHLNKISKTYIESNPKDLKDFQDEFYNIMNGI